MEPKNMHEQQRKEISQLTETNNITKEAWEQYLTEVFKGDERFDLNTPQTRQYIRE